MTLVAFLIHEEAADTTLYIKTGWKQKEHIWTVCFLIYKIGIGKFQTFCSLGKLRISLFCPGSKNNGIFNILPLSEDTKSSESHPAIIVLYPCCTFWRREQLDRHWVSAASMETADTKPRIKTPCLALWFVSLHSTSVSRHAGPERGWEFRPIG